jgi:hypothetical protein
MSYNSKQTTQSPAVSSSHCFAADEVYSLCRKSHRLIYVQFSVVHFLGLVFRLSDATSLSRDNAVAAVRTRQRVIDLPSVNLLASFLALIAAIKIRPVVRHQNPAKKYKKN